MRELAGARLDASAFRRRLPAALPSLPGLRSERSARSAGNLEYTGPLPPLLEWLAQRPVEDVRIEPLGLAAIYRRYHGAEA